MLQYFITVMAIYVKLWNTLSNEGYPELSRIALGILVIAPENASCERAFSIMKFIKNNLVFHNCI